MMANRVPLWSVTTWDKKYSAVEKEWQPQTIKYKYLLSDELDRICVDGGDVRLLYTGKDIGYTTEALAGDALAEGEIVAIPWGGTPSVKYFKGKFVTGDNRIATSSKPDELLNKYLYYFLLGNLKEISTYYRGAGLKHPAMRDILNMKISYPTVEKQAQIIAQFDLLQEIIDKRKQQIVELDHLIKARFVELFGDRYTNDKKWENKPLAECADFYNGKAHEQVVDENGEYILVTSRCIASDITDYRRTNALLFPLKTNDIAMVMSDVPNGRALAKCILIDENDKYTLNQRICCLRNYSFNPIFFYYLLNRHEYFLSFNDGNAQTNLRKDDLLACNIIMPPLELQNQFAAFVEQTDKSKIVVQKALEEAQTLFDSLMQEYFG